MLPALAVADQFKRQDPDTAFYFAATADSIEEELITRAGYRPELVRAAPLRGGSISRWPRGLAIVPAALADATALVRRINPDVAIGTGGYLSGGILLAAARRGVPTVLIELNVRPGLANRFLSPFVDIAAVAWPATAASFGSKTVLTGAPVRSELLGIAPCHPTDAMHLLVLGGSLGAPSLNRAISAALPTLMQSCARLTFAHQTGPDGDEVRAAYGRLGVPARVASFFHDVGAEYARADLVITAAGAMTCAELAAVRRPSILVPLSAAGHHQRANAEAMARTGAAVVIDECVLTPDALIEAVGALANHGRRRASMAAAAATLARPAAAEAVAELARKLSETRHEEGVVM